MPTSTTPTLDSSLGVEAPVFEFLAADGKMVSLRDLRGQPVVLAFFPTDWDPSRPHQLAQYNKVLDELVEHGSLVEVAAHGDSCDVHVRAEDPVRFTLLHRLVDRPDIVKLYEVEGRQGLFVLDANGIILWRHIGPTGTYPPLDEFIKALTVQPSGGLSRRQFLVAAAAVSLAATLLPRSGLAATPAEGPDPTSSGRLRLSINGRPYDVEADSRITLLDALRERLGLTGTKKGCDHGQCGSCTVHMNGRRVISCLTLAPQAEGAHITTIEGLARGDELHPVQRAFIEQDGYQCGYCTPGQVMSAVACIQEGHTGSDAEIKEWMSGNICRCGAYVGICEAIHKAKANMGAAK